MIDYVFAVVVGVLSAAAVGYAYRAARAAEEVLRKLETWESAWRRHTVTEEEEWEEEEEGGGEGWGEEERPRAKRVQRGGGGEDYVAQVVKRVECAGELMKARGGCAPVQEVVEKCGVNKRTLDALFKLREKEGVACLRT